MDCHSVDLHTQDHQSSLYGELSEQKIYMKLKPLPSNTDLNLVSSQAEGITSL